MSQYGEFMYNFLKYRWISALLSLTMFATFIGFSVYNYKTKGHVFTYSVDFTGGTQVLYKFQDKVSANQIRSILEKQGWKKPVIREFGEKEILVRVPEFSSDIEGLGTDIQNAIEETLPDNPSKILQIDSVGPGIGKTLRWKSAMTVLLALALILLYIGWRFWSFGYAIGAIVSLFHDAFAILTFFLIFDKEISINVIGAILAVLGYSINDTIVIFSKIRDNVKKMRGTPLKQVVNVSLNQTLRRTILTSVSTALVTIALIIIGGESLRDLSLALLIGIIFGTYSSIYIASPIMLLLQRKK